jgi:hypothetical protein
MATPQAPIATLQSRLQALYNVIILTFVIAISLFPGVAVTLLWLVGEVGKDVGNINRRGRWPRRLHYYTKVGSRDRGLVVERSSFESLTDVNHALWSLIMEPYRTVDSIIDSNEPR